MGSSLFLANIWRRRREGGEIARVEGRAGEGVLEGAKGTWGRD